MRRGLCARLHVVPIAVVLIAVCAATAACGTSQVESSPDSGPSGTESVTLELGAPDPPLPADANEVPFGLGQPAALGNLQVTMTRVIVSGESVTVQLTVRNGSLEPLVLADDTFRLYLQDGSSTIMRDDGTILGVPVQSGESVDGAISVDVTSDSPPSLVLVNGGASDERLLPGAFVLGTLTVQSSED